MYHSQETRISFAVMQLRKKPVIKLLRILALPLTIPLMFLESIAEHPVSLLAIISVPMWGGMVV